MNTICHFSRVLVASTDLTPFLILKYEQINKIVIFTLALEKSESFELQIINTG